MNRPCWQIHTLTTYDAVFIIPVGLVQVQTSVKSTNGSPASVENELD